MSEKKYFWLKLKKQMFEDNEAMDFLLSQKNGSDYAMIYILLCLKTLNSNGELASRIGEMIIPYSPEKIERDLKYFKIDTITVALELYKQLGLVYENQNGAFVIANYENLIGSETASAERVRQYRERKKQALLCNENVTQEYRDKSIEYRDKNIDIENRNIEDDSLRSSSMSSSLQENDPSADKETATDSSSETISTPSIPYTKIQEKFNEICKSLPKCTKLSDERKRKIKSRCLEFSEEEIFSAFKKGEESDFLTGRSGQWLGCTFDWFFANNSHIRRILEGSYDNGRMKRKPKLSGRRLSAVERDYQADQVVNSERIDF